MSLLNRCLCAACVAASLGLAAAANAQVAAAYTITDLGTLANSTINTTGLNSSGVVVGFSNVPTANSSGVIVSSPHAFKTGPNGAGGATDMGLLPYTPGTVAGSYARGVNDSGLIVGYGTTAVPDASAKSNFNHAFLSNGTSLTDIGTLGPSVITLGNGNKTANNSIGYGVSNTGYVTGYGTNAQNGAATAATFHAFRMNSNTESALSGSDDLGVLAGGTSSYGYAVNNAGTVVGRSTLGGTTDYHAIRATAGGTMQDLGTLKGTSEAFAINSAGTIVGDSYDNSGTTGVQQAFRLTTDQNGITAASKLFTVTGAKVGGIGSSATAINDNGTIVGYFNVDTTLKNYVYHAFIFGNQNYSSDNYQAYDLNNYLTNGAGWTLQYAEGINNAGQVAGYGTVNGATHAFLLTPAAVPEPSLLVSFALAGLGGGLLARRSRQKRAR